MSCSDRTRVEVRLLALVLFPVLRAPSSLLAAREYVISP